MLLLRLRKLCLRAPQLLPKELLVVVVLWLCGF
jgi:hypothetical protein